MAQSSQFEALDGSADQEIDDITLGREGINMMLNNGFSEAEVLFKKYREFSPLMSYGYSFVNFMQALMTFEDAKLAAAMQDLQDTEKRCQVKDGFMSGIGNMFRGVKSEKPKLSAEEKLQRQIIIADCMICQAMLTFINQDITSYVKGGWILRKAWKIYEKIHKEITHLHNTAKGIIESQSSENLKAQGSSVDGNGVEEALEILNESDIPENNINGSNNTEKRTLKDLRSDSVQSNLLSLDFDGSTVEFSEETLERLLGSVNFGYGNFQLCISMVPPKILKLIEFLGFEGDRDVGLKALDHCSHSKDMKAPLARLGLLWYHTVIRQFFALDGADTNAGIPEAEIILEEVEKEYPDSALFLFYKGRLQRLKCELNAAMVTYEEALQKAEKQREIQIICLYEIGWGSVMRLKWQEGLKCFLRLREESRWSKAYYAYLSGICQGALGDVKGAYETFKEVPKLIKRKNNQIEAFCAKRVERYKKKAATQEHCVLLGLEVLYLWNVLPQCNKEDLENMKQECDKQMDKNVFHLRSLIEAALYKEQGENEIAIQCFEEAIARQNGMKDDLHVVAFATYEIASLLILSPETLEQGKKMLIKAKDKYKDYEFENRLNVRIHAALKRLKEKPAEK
ncbi:unnamed protein product [Owenia fusiformis]|uniref:Uncharacterized protein n=1 Tax=Owenia fusiformis TaxID=6347 RepID=A0A8J1U912_OWEFU|nr:unnamed protein product [Owenia fusiformis]